MYPQYLLKIVAKSGELLLEKIIKLYDDCSHELHKIITLGENLSRIYISELDISRPQV